TACATRVGPQVTQPYFERKKTQLTTETTETHQEKARCEISPDCLHPVCECGSTIRSSGQRIKDHPATVQGSLKRGQCQHCIIRRVRTRKPRYVSVKRLQGIESLPTEDERIRHVSPGFWGYLQRRRAAGIPEDGIRFKEITQ